MIFLMNIRRVVIVAALAVLVLPAFALAQMEGTPGPKAMTGKPMEHPAASPPLYREPTFLVLVGVATSAVGFAAYRVPRSRWR
jgi:hypothetical protein